MRKSMTAYGRARLQTKRAGWTVEVSSVNRKGLDIHLHLPHHLLFLDPTLREWVAQTAQRGNVTVRLLCELKEVSHLAEQLKNEKKRWEKIAAELQLSLKDITLPFLLSQIVPQDVIGDEASFKQELAEVWKKASKAWNSMKIQEGKRLVQDIQCRLKVIQKEMKEIEKEIPSVEKYHLEKLLARMGELKLKADQDLLKQEAALQACRDDVTEEIIRLKSHLEQIVLYLRSSEASVGRTLDFLAQEMGREIGTLMAKAGSSKIAEHAVRIKSEIEKIREQVQNIE
jgi:uncharacterized protein (TIGR00255 family)